MSIQMKSRLLGLTIFTAYFWAFMWPVVYIIALECQGKIVITHYFYKGEVDEQKYNKLR